MNNGYIKLHRQFLEWEWYQNPNVVSVFLHCLLKANYTDKKWQGITIKKGSFITSYQKISNELSGKTGGLSVQQVRTALENLKSTGELTIKTSNKYTHISINNWSYFQDDNTQLNKQITTTKNNKNNKNNIKINLNRRTAEQVAFQFPKESEAIVLENNQSEAVVKESREGKPSKGRNVVVDHTLEEFKRIVGYYPTDRHPRRIAWNIQQKFTTITRERLGGEVTDERLKKGITTFFNWLSGEDWIDKVERLETIKNKLPKFEATLPERGA